MRVANIATYPAREESALPGLRSIARQVDVLHLVLNEYQTVPASYRTLPNLEPLIPRRDLKDLGKFVFEVGPDDDVFLCDDDIIYPSDYVAWMVHLRQTCPTPGAILGVHGVTYSDYYDGRGRSGRLVHHFQRPLDRFTPVNQLGTGTVYLRGRQLPPAAYMEGSSGFVDIRFARYAFEKGDPLVCVPRQVGWLTEIENDSTLYLTITRSLPLGPLREIQTFGGVSRLGPIPEV